MPAWILLEPCQVHRKKNFTKNQVQSHSNYEFGIENQECFTKSLKAKVCNIFLSSYFKKRPHILQEMLTILLILISTTTFIKVLTFHRRSLWKTIQILTFQILGIFKNNILKFIRPKRNGFFNCCNLKVTRLITRLRLELI